MKANIKKRLSFVLMLLMLCPLLVASRCDSAWETADKLPDSYFGDYQIAEVYVYINENWVKKPFKVETSYEFGGSYIEIQHQYLLINSGDPKVLIRHQKYTLDDETIDIESLTEVLGNLQHCKQVHYADPGGGVFTANDERCDSDYRASGRWGFPGLGMEDMIVKYSFSGTTWMTMTFTDSEKPDRNFKLVCVRKL